MPNLYALSFCNLDSALALESERSGSSWPGHITQSIGYVNTDGCYGEGYGGRDIEIDGEFFAC